MFSLLNIRDANEKLLGITRRILPSRLKKSFSQLWVVGFLRERNRHPDMGDQRVKANEGEWERKEVSRTFQGNRQAVSLVTHRRGSAWSARTAVAGRFHRGSFRLAGGRRTSGNRQAFWRCPRGTRDRNIRRAAASRRGVAASGRVAARGRGPRISTTWPCRIATGHRRRSSGGRAR